MKWTRLAGFLSFALCAFGQDIPVQIDTFLSLFPADTETVLASGQKFDIPDKTQAEDPSGPHTVGLAYLLRPLGDAFGRERFTEFDGRTISSALLGARNFSAPLGLGLAGREECAIYQFQESVEDIEIPEPTAVERESLPRETYTSVLLTPNVLLVCNDTEFLQSIRSRRAAGAARVALPAGLPEWAHVDRGQRVWGLRHFANNPRDVTNPRRGVDLVFDVNAQGATLQVTTAFTRVRWITQPGENPLVEVAGASDFENAGKTFAVLPGVWELNDEAKPSSFGVFVAMALLGFYIAI
jgi:hypothetical protein